MTKRDLTRVCQTCRQYAPQQVSDDHEHCRLLAAWVAVGGNTTALGEQFNLRWVVSPYGCDNQAWVRELPADWHTLTVCDHWEAAHAHRPADL